MPRPQLVETDHPIRVEIFIRKLCTPRLKAGESKRGQREMEVRPQRPQVGELKLRLADRSFSLRLEGRMLFGRRKSLHRDRLKSVQDPGRARQKSQARAGRRVLATAYDLFSRSLYAVIMLMGLLQFRPVALNQSQSN